MKQKLLLFFVALFTTTSAFAYDFKVDNIYYNKTIDGRSVGVTYRDNNYSSYSGAIVIPESVYYNGRAYSVSYIGESAFRNCTRLTEVTIPNSVTSIGESAFYSCSGLTEVSIPNSVTSIGESAFYSCKGLTSVTIPNSVTVIGDYAFYGCSGLTSVTIPNSVTVIGDYAFYGCSGLTSVTIPNSVTTIGSDTFFYCSGLTSVTIPSSITSIGSDAFSNCSYLTSVNIQDIEAWCKIDFGNVTSNPLYYAHDLYLNGEKLTDLVIPDSVTSIGNYAFSRCSDLTSVTIPSSITSIGSYAFSNCHGLTTVNFNATNCVTTGSSVFAGCTNFTTLNINENVTNIPNSAFYGCSGLTSVTIPNSVTVIGDSAFDGCSGLTSLTIPDSVISIGESAFSGCSGIVSLTIGNSVSSIGKFAFKGCSSLSDVKFVDGSETLSLGYNNYSGSSEGQGLFSNCPIQTLYLGRDLTYDSRKSYGYSPFYNSPLKELFISQFVTKIDSYAFGDCFELERVNIENLEAWCKIIFKTPTSNPLRYAKQLFLNDEEITDLKIPDSVISINNYAFYNFTELTSLNIPESVTSIGNSAFYSCTGLTALTVGSSVKSIDSEAFKGCNGINEIVSTAVSAPTIKENSFDGLYETAILKIPSGTLESYLSNNWGLFKAISVGGKDIERLNDNVFSYIINNDNGDAILTAVNDRTMSSVSIPSRVVIEHGEDASFHQVTAIGKAAFKGMSSMTNVNIPANLTTICPDAFADCNGLKKVNITNLEAWCKIKFETYTSNPLYYAERLYLNNEEITNLVIPNTISYVGDRAFCYCTRLTKVTIPNSVTAIGGGTFIGCTGLTKVTIPNSVTSIGGGSFSGCTGLTKVTIPNSVTSIGGSAFSSCTGLTEVTIPNSVTSSIGNYAFYKCTGLTSVEIGNSVSSIGDNAFYGCSGLTSLTIPNSVTAIGDVAFYACTNLTSLTIGNSVTTIGRNAFKDCTSLTSVTIGNSVTTIDAYAFAGTKLSSVSIPASVEEIGTKAFYSSEIKSLIFEEGVKELTLDNEIIPRDITLDNLTLGRQTSLIPDTKAKTLVIGNLVTQLPENAFRSFYYSLEKVSIGSGLTEIPAGAFKGCSKLSEIIVPKNVETIGANAFNGCSGINNIAIGSGITSIGELAFNSVNSADKVCVAAIEPPTANNNTFSNYNAPLYVPEESIDSYYNYPRCWFRYDEPNPLKIVTDITIEGDGNIFNLEPGESIKLVAKIEPADATLPYIFWRTTNPTVATVDNYGNVLVLDHTKDEAVAFAESENRECEIIAETMYADSPIAKVRVSVTTTGVDVVVVDNDNETNPVGICKTTDVYNLQGICVKRNATADDVNTLPAGIYIYGGKKLLIK